MHVRHAQFNQKSAIFGLQIGSFQGRSFPTAGQRNEDAGYEGALRMDATHVHAQCLILGEIYFR